MADEPVSALDVSIQSQVLNLMRKLQAERDLTYVLISHDLAVVRYLADRVGVMYLGKMVEIGTGEEIYASPAHPYTSGLLESVPVPDPVQERGKHKDAVRGELPSAATPLRAAGSARGARSHSSYAPTWSPRCSCSAPGGTGQRATSRSSNR